MTVGGDVPPPPPGWVLVGEGTPPPTRPRRKRWLAVVSASVVAVGVAVGVAAGYVVLTDDDSPYPDA